MLEPFTAHAVSQVDVGAVPARRRAVRTEGELGLRRRVSILRKRQVVGLYGGFVAPDDRLTAGLGVGSVVEAWVELEHARKVRDRLLIILLLLGQAGPRIDQHRIVVLIHADLALHLVGLLEAE